MGVKQTHHGNDRGRKLLRVSDQDELVATMDEWSKGLNLTGLPSLGKKAQKEKGFPLISAVSLFPYSLSSSHKVNIQKSIHFLLLHRVSKIRISECTLVMSAIFF